MAEAWLWITGGICVQLVLFPLMVYLCFKFARMGYLRAEKAFEEQQQKSSDNSKCRFCGASIKKPATWCSEKCKQHSEKGI